MKKSLSIENYVEVSSHKINTLQEINKEIDFWLYQRQPKRILIDLKRQEDGYNLNVYIPSRDSK